MGSVQLWSKEMIKKTLDGFNVLPGYQAQALENDNPEEPIAKAMQHIQLREEEAKELEPEIIDAPRENFRCVLPN